MDKTLPDEKTMYTALLNKDSNFEGIFFVGVKTTGIFCRPTCRARKPRQENVEFFYSTREALIHSYRPCKICNPLGFKGDVPRWLKPVLEEIQDNPAIRLKDSDLRARGIDPNRIRRWFKQNHGMTFQAYLRLIRIGNAFGKIKNGDKVIEAAFDSAYESLSGFTYSFKKSTGFSPNKSKYERMVMITRILTPLGPMLAGASEKGICLLEFVDRRMVETNLNRLKKLHKAEFVVGSNKHIDQLEEQLKAYFTGQQKQFTVPLDLAGTPFQRKVWDALRNVSYGTTQSYQKLAENLGNPRAVRAVARANGDNRIAIVIPCHRIIGKNGKLTGYGGGLWRKQYLLNLEFENLK